MRTLTLCLALLALCPATTSATELRVQRVLGETLDFSCPAGVDVRVGDKASVSYGLTLKSRRVEVQVAEIQVTRTTPPICKALVLSHREQVEPGYAVVLERIPVADPDAPVAVSLADPGDPPPEGSGSLHVASDPPGGEVWLDGRRVPGVTPRALTDVPVGSHVIEVRLGGHASASAVHIRAGEPVVLDVRLVPAEGVLAIESLPPGGQVYVDGVERGRAPALIEGLAGGPHLVQVTRPGHQAWSQIVDMAPRGRTPLTVTLTPLGQVRVGGGPPDARVLVDGRARCAQVPCLIDLAAGAHALRVERPGHVPAGRVVNVRAGQVDALDLHLERMPVVQVDETLPGATVSVDGEPLGQAPLAIALGRLEPLALEIAAPGHQTTRHELRPRPGERLRLSSGLLPLRAARSRAWIVGGAVTTAVGVAAGVAGGILLFLADREDGRADDRHQVYLGMPTGGPASAYQGAWNEVEAHVDRSRRLGQSGVGLLAVGGAAALAGLFVWIDPFWLDAGTPTVAPAPSGAGLSLSWRGTW